MSVTHTRIPFNLLVFLDDNPRTRTPEGLQQMAADIQADPTFFDNRPVLVNLTDGTHQVYAGDLRAHAAHDVLGWADIPCIVERDVPPEVMRRRAIIDNLHRETWAPDILASSWASDDLADWGLTPDKWGAEQPDTPATGYTASEDDYQPPAEIVTDIVTGDLFEIGPHRLLCGDSTSADDVAKVMGGEKVEICVTSPPYNVAKNSTLKNKNKYLGSSESDSLSENEYLDLLANFTKNTLSFAKYSFINIQSVSGNKISIIKYLNLFQEKFCDFMIWDKLGSEPAMAENVLNSRFEFVFILGGNGTRTVGEKKFRGTIENVFQLNSRQGKEFSDIHKATFPVGFSAFFIDNFSENSVYDPFLGSGTTMVAAHQLHRRCFGIEIDPKYCQVILDRMLKLDPTLTITRNGKKY